jgi:hypothetical protein
MINDDERDYAEERANLADMRREAEAEAAFEEQRADLVDRFRALADGQQQQARRGLAVLAEGIEGRSRLRDESVLFVRRAAATAHLAERAAVTIERHSGYDLRGQVVALLSAATASTPDGVTLAAADRVRELLRLVLHEQEQREQDAREQADLDETHRSLR